MAQIKAALLAVLVLLSAVVLAAPLPEVGGGCHDTVIAAGNTRAGASSRLSRRRAKAAPQFVESARTW